MAANSLSGLGAEPYETSAAPEPRSSSSLSDLGAEPYQAQQPSQQIQGPFAGAAARVTEGYRQAAEALTPQPGQPYRNPFSRALDVVKGAGEIVSAPFYPANYAGQQAGDRLTRNSGEMTDQTLDAKIARARDIKAKTGSAAGASAEVNELPMLERLRSMPYEERVKTSREAMGAGVEGGVGLATGAAGAINPGWLLRAPGNVARSIRGVNTAERVAESGPLAPRPSLSESVRQAGAESSPLAPQYRPDLLEGKPTVRASVTPEGETVLRRAVTPLDEGAAANRPQGPLAIRVEPARGAVDNVPEGHIRLFRGEGPRGGEPTWKDPEMVQFQGRWFSPDRALAESHGKDVAGKASRVLFVDVPKDVYEAAKVAGKPEARFLYGGVAESDTALLSPEWATKAKPHAVGREPLPNTLPERVAKGPLAQTVEPTSPLAPAAKVGDNLAEGVRAQAPGLGAAWENTVDNIGRAIADKIVPNYFRDNKAVNYFRAGRGTPIEFREARALLEAEIAEGAEQAVSLGTTLQRGLSSAEQVRAGQVLRGGITSDPKLLEVTRPARAAIDNLQQELVKTGRLSQETVERFEQNFGSYLRRMYDSKILKEPEPVVYGAIPTRMKHTFERGDRMEIGLTREMENSPKLRLEDPEIAKLVKDGYKLESVNPKDHTATYFRDVSAAARKEMGEVVKPAYPVATGLAQGSRDVAMSKFFKTVSENAEWTRTAPAPGFTQMGKDAETLGALANKYVRSNIAAELNDAIRIKTDSEKILGRFTSWWKIGKVMNPATIARNVMSSAMMADWGGLSPIRHVGVYFRALGGLAGKNEKAAVLVEEARKLGLYRSGYNTQELSALYDGFQASKETNALLKVLDGISTTMAKSGKQVAGVLRPVGGNMVAEGIGHPTRIYGAVDQIFRTALYVHGRERGLSPQLALRYAKKYAVDYQDISPFTRHLRGAVLGAPFATFASKAIPLALETAVKHPVRFFKWQAIILGTSELSLYTTGASREDVASDRKLAKYNPLRYALLPTLGPNGERQYLDVGYILPYGDVLNMYDWATGNTDQLLPQTSFMPGGPVGMIVEAVANKSVFRDKPIYKGTDTRMEKGGKLADFLGKGLLSPLTPPIPGTGFTGGHTVTALRRAYAPGVQLPGEPPLSPTDAAGAPYPTDLRRTLMDKALGIKITQPNVARLKQIEISKLEANVLDLRKELAAIQRGGFTPQQKVAETARIEGKIKRLYSETLERLR